MTCGLCVGVLWPLWVLRDGPWGVPFGVARGHVSGQWWSVAGSHSALSSSSIIPRRAPGEVNAQGRVMPLEGRRTATSYRARPLVVSSSRLTLRVDICCWAEGPQGAFRGAGAGRDDDVKASDEICRSLHPCSPAPSNTGHHVAPSLSLTLPDPPRELAWLIGARSMSRAAADSAA